MTTPLAIPSICEQRRQLALMNQPPTRLELQFPPPGFTTSQLDMRRKTEILQYNAAKTNTKTNNLTKAQKFTLLANNNTSQGLSQRFLQTADPAIPVCPYDISIPTPTTSCDVPGPLMYLVYDPSVPLYNYATNTDAFAILNKEIIDIWTLSSSTDTVFPNGVSQTLLFVSFTSLADKGNYLFSLVTPVSIYMSATSTGNMASNIADFSISAVQFGIYYSGQLVTPVTSPIISYSFTDLSLNTNSTSGSFYAVQYVGMLNISNIPLSVSPGMVYEFRLTFTINYDINKTTPYMNNLLTGTYCNITDENINRFNHCIVGSSPSNEPISTQDFTIVNY